MKYFNTFTRQSLKANLWRAKEIISRERPLALIFWFPADGKKGQGSNPVMAFSAQPAIKQVLVGACIIVYKQYQSMQKQYLSLDWLGLLAFCQIFISYIYSE